MTPRPSKSRGRVVLDSHRLQVSVGCMVGGEAASAGRVGGGKARLATWAEAGSCRNGATTARRRRWDPSVGWVGREPAAGRASGTRRRRK